MPVILDPGSESLKTWLDPNRHEWSRELQSLLQPFKGDVEVYPVNKDVGKVGNSSPSFIIPLDSKENKSNIANFFANASKKKVAEKHVKEDKQEESKGYQAGAEERESMANLPLAEVELTTTTTPGKRKLESSAEEGQPLKKALTSSTARSSDKKTSATRNEYKSPPKSKTPGTQKITKFFGNSA